MFSFFLKNPLATFELIEKRHLHGIKLKEKTLFFVVENAVCVCDVAYS